MIYIELKAANKDKKEENNNENNNPPENDDNKNDEDKKENNQNEENKEEKKEEVEKEEDNNEDKKSNKENNKENNNIENKEIEQVNNIIIDSNRKITNTDIKNSSTLILEEKECNIFNGEKIKINALGMIGGRGVGDGVAIFGSNANQLEESANMNTGASILKPDFILK